MGTTQLEGLSLIPCRPPDWQSSSRNGRPSRKQRLEFEPIARTNKFARTTATVTTTAVEGTPRRKEAFKQLVDVVCGRGSTAGNGVAPRERQSSAKANDRHYDDLVQQPPKRYRSTTASGCNEYTAPTEIQGNNHADTDATGDCSSIFDADDGTGADGGTGADVGMDATTDHECN